jgi:dienelactone hydrolase
MDRWIERPRRVMSKFAIALFVTLLPALIPGEGQVLSPTDAARLRKEMRQALFVPDPLPAVEPESYGTFKPTPAVVAERVSYRTEYGLRVPAIVYRPATPPKGKLPAMVLVNGHGGDKSSWYSYYTGILYATAGAVVVTYDPIGSGESNDDRKQAASEHDTLITDPPSMPARMGGRMVTDILQGVSYLAQRKDVDPKRIAVLGFSMGSFEAVLAGAADPRIHALMLTGGGDIDGPGGYWDASHAVMCQSGPYKALNFLGDRPAVIYTLNARRGNTFILNGTADTVVDIPHHEQDFFDAMKLRTEAINGGPTGVFETAFDPGASHRPNWITRPVAEWLGRNLNFPNWPQTKIATLPLEPIRDWAARVGYPLGKSGDRDDRDAGLQAIAANVPLLTQDQLNILSPSEWERRKAEFVYKTWVERAEADAQSAPKAVATDKSNANDKPAVGTVVAVLKPAQFRHYVDTFRSQEREATGSEYLGESNEDAWAWMQREIPWFESSNKQFEEMYYFRWYAWKKHLVAAPSGYVITEWLPKPDFPSPDHKDGSFGALPDAAPFHIAEARWLRDPKIAEDDARYWFSHGVDSHKYSDAMAWTVRDLTLANGDRALNTALLPAMIANYHAWETTQQDANGLFWSIDTRDAMEKSISGDGYRPTLNSYMYGDARAIADLTTDLAIKAEFTAKADRMHELIETKLWNPKDEFYEVVSPSSDSGIRQQKKFADPGTTMQLAGVREQIGYIPWLFGIPAPNHAIAWKQLFDPQGFDGKYGATTAERRSPRFRFESSDQCTWNGPAWPFAMTQTLNALATYEDTPGASVMTPADFYKLFERYVLAQHLKLPNGHVIDWIDEDLDADTDEWIAKDMLLAKNKQVGRGNYYNHSGFADPLITGLIGLRPRADNIVELHPLLPVGTWTYFAMDGLPYHGHLLTILWDQTGKQYGRSRGLTLLVDGKMSAQRIDLGPLEGKLE